MTKHPGFKAVAKGIAAREGIPAANAGAILANATRKASPAAKAANPNLNNVSGMPNMAKGMKAKKMPNMASGKWAARKGQEDN